MDARQELREQLDISINMIGDQVAHALTKLKALYPAGTDVEVRFSDRQHNWSPAIVRGIEIQLIGMHAVPLVLVDLHIHSTYPRIKHTRAIPLDRVRLLNTGKTK
jgi:hypothetical protein